MRPLADLLRPTTLYSYIGQDYLVGKDSPIIRIIETKNLYSFIFWDPSGYVKTSLTQIIPSSARADFLKKASMFGKHTLKILYDF
ncbi:MAG: hypothetical protein Fur0011_6410 [Candidatus Microgenomates bacterium]